jgi:hypothetical protein
MKRMSWTRLRRKSLVRVVVEAVLAYYVLPRLVEALSRAVQARRTARAATLPGMSR